MLQEARQSLIDKLGGKSAELDRLVYRLTFVQCMYLISIYRLESLRSGLCVCAPCCVGGEGGEGGGGKEGGQGLNIHVMFQVGAEHPSICRHLQVP